VIGANQLNVNATTNAQGQATLTYQGVNSGTDQITAFADVNNNNQQDVGDPFVQASAQFTVRAADRVIVPSVIGLTTAAAKTKLEAARLTLGTTRSDLGTVSLRAESVASPVLPSLGDRLAQPSGPSLGGARLLPPTGPDLPEPGPRAPFPRPVVRIVAQNPAAGAQVVAGSAVNVTLGNFDEDPFPFPQTEFESS
jgi:hypothetical protein